MFLHNRINVERNKKSCATLANSQHAKEVSENRKYLKFIIEEIHIFLINKALLLEDTMKMRSVAKIWGTLKSFINFIVDT